MALSAQERILARNRRLILDHSIVGQPDELEIRRDRPFTCCRLCGAVFQPEIGRVDDDEYTAEVILAAEIERREWSQRHARIHPEWEHQRLERSGRFCTPEATIKLVPYGIVPLTDLGFMGGDEEIVQAALEAPRCPTDSPESTIKSHVYIEKGL